MSNRSVLIIEDSKDQALLIQHDLKKYFVNDEIKIFESGGQALASLNEAKDLPKLIILDLNLGEEQGLDFLESLRQHDELKDVPVIVMSATDEKRDVIDAYKKGGTAFIPKSANQSEHLLTVIQQLGAAGRIR